MSTPKYRIHPKVLERLHFRGVTVEQLAARAGTGRAHATQVLANKPGRGHLTRKRLAPWLTSTELALLGWNPAGCLISFPAERSNTLDRHAPTVAGLREEPGCETPGVADSALNASNGKHDTPAIKPDPSLNRPNV